MRPLPIRIITRRLVVSVCVLLTISLGAGAHAQQRSARGQEFYELGQQIGKAIQEGRDDQAEQMALQRLEIAGEGNGHMQRAAYFTLGTALAAQGRAAEAEIALNKALDMQNPELAAGRDLSIKILGRLAVVQGQQGKLALANQSMELTMGLLRQQGFNSADDLKWFRPLIHNLMQLKQFDQAQARLDEAFGIANRLPATVDLNFRLGQLREVQGDLLARTGRHRQAVAEFDKALTLYSPQNPDIRTDVQRCALSKAESLLRVGQTAEAAAVVATWLPMIRDARGEKHTLYARARVLQAHAVSLTEPSEALPLYAQAWAIFLDNDANNELVQLLPRYVAALQSAGQLGTARDVTLTGLDRIDRLFGQTQGLDDRVREDLARATQGNFERALELLTRMNRDTPGAGHDRDALGVLSRMQSRLFTEQLRKADVKSYSKNTALMDKVRVFKAESARLDALRLQGLVRGQTDADPVAPTSATEDPMVAQRRIKSDTEYRERRKAQSALVKTLADDLWKTFPRYMELTRPRAIDVTELQKTVLRKDDAVLSYALLEHELLIFLTTQHQLVLRSVPVERSDLNRWVQEVRATMENPGDNLEHLQDLNPATLHRLYSILIEPVQAELAAYPRWIVVADGPLFTLPFELLVSRWGPREQTAFEALKATQGDTLGQYRVLNYLARNTRISYLPSLSSLVSVRLYSNPLPRFETELTSFANPSFGSASGDVLERAQRSLHKRGALSIPPLPETETEARQLAQVLGKTSRLFLGEEAQEHRVKTENLASTRYLHFATHGLLGSETARLNDGPAALNQPALLMSLSGNLRGEDGLLTMSEILGGLTLNAELAVLSACNTAGETSKANSGEGFAGLTRAFMFAGAHRLMVSHWSVESATTERLVTHTFQGLTRGNTADAALDQARKDLIQDTLTVGGVALSTAHPYFWAPFVLVGD
ncbi:CHAT domain-containing protein [Limnobacter humi]|uniref:CHAT domain-containing protein n=1 Tax=Limnobacter humi TaxID=1778671 RepID=A0ABT1WLF9_9BURK|nr:CHAT domain-containing tetratricopeptide repeat protein [Limnobacter humi]MCQ8897714.1 CHAT domain-containing protein [Limnobacter humi]